MLSREGKEEKHRNWDSWRALGKKEANTTRNVKKNVPARLGPVNFRRRKGGGGERK